MIADTIKTMRERINITQSELAKKLNVTRACVNAWEMGISTPSNQYLVELANIFKVSTDYILGMTEKETVDITNLTEEQKKVLYTMLNYFEEEN